MPIYEYKCDKCGKVIEKLVKSDLSNEPKLCENMLSTEIDDPTGIPTYSWYLWRDCKGNLERQLSSANASFKGKGFYCTDFKNK